MFNLLLLVVMLGILVSLGAGLFFLVRGRSEHTVISLSIRVALSVLLLVLLAWGFANRFVMR